MGKEKTVGVFIKTYGCQANVADSAHLATYLQGLGCQLVSSEDRADLIIINSCAIREKAEHKMFSYLGSLASYKKKKPYLAIGVVGCVASYRQKEIMERAHYVNFVFGARDDREYCKAYLVDLIESIAAEKKLYYREPETYKPAKIRDRDVVSVVKKRRLTVPSKLIQAKPSLNEFKRSMVNIMRGCNNYCSYCIVPFTTGRERSFTMRSIVDAVARDVAHGAKEVTLLGQNVNSYCDPETGAGFAALLERVAQITGEFWVRFVSPHPKNMTVDVIEVIAAHPEKLCSYIHLPLQSGSNTILQAMNRTYTVQKYLEQVAMIRERLPQVVLTTDIIVGFPGEAQQDYLATRDVMEEVRFHTIFSFVYSPRKYTKAAELVDSCSQEEKNRRLQELQARQREIGTQENRLFVGKTVRVLLEEQHDPDFWWGRTEGNVRVLVKGEGCRMNQFVAVCVEEAQLTDLRGIRVFGERLVRRMISL